MSRNQVDDEFVAVRVQDPRIQNEGSWNSYVDYKIFIHTNSKAFTAKTSCVRRRYSEFVWLRRKLQRNAGLVPVPDLPGKSIFYFSNEDFLERRRKGLQVFLNKVVHMTVCLSDSQLHLFLQTQLPVGHIQDCVQGLTPFSVMDAILTYASSNQGLAQAQAQAQEEESIREPSLTISYESMESPVPHQPHVTPNPEVLPCEESNTPVDILDSDEVLHKKKPSVRISQKSNHLEVVVEDREPTQATFYVGEDPRDPRSLGSVEQTGRRSCLIQTPVEVHSPMEADCGVDNLFEEEESDSTINPDKKTVDHLQSKENKIKVNSEPEMCLKSEEVSSLRVKNTEEEVGESVPVPEDVCSEKPDLEHPVKSHVYKGPSANVKSETRETNSDDKISDESGCKDETLLLLEMHVIMQTQNVDREPEGEPCDLVQEKHQQEVKRTDKDEILLMTPNMNGAPDYLVQDRHQQEVELVNNSDVLLQADVHVVTQNVDREPEGEPCDSVQEKHQQEVKHVGKDEILLMSPNVNGAPELEPDNTVQEKLQQEVEHMETNVVLLQSEVHVVTQDVDREPEGEPGDSVQEKHQQEVKHVGKDEILLMSPNVNGAPDYLVQEKHKQEMEQMDKSDVLLRSEVHVHGGPEVEPGDSVQEKHREDESEEDSRSLTSSDESVIIRSEEESVCEDTEDVRNWSEEEASNKNVLDLHMNGSPEDEEDTSGQDDGDQQHTTIKDRMNSAELQPTRADGDVTENGDFSILESSCLTGGETFTKLDAPSSPLLNGSEETRSGQ